MAELLLKQISHLGAKPQVVTLPTRLIRRESCRPLMAAEQGTLKDEIRAS
jgi:DNA-binding LacI/PurR family transcriptional regulator